MSFTNRLINRRLFPTKHVIVCEDDVDMQSKIIALFARMFDSQGLVQISLVPGAAQAAGILSRVGAELIILDHDMPFGNGIDLLTWLKSNGHVTPVITFSGIDANNDALMNAGATHKFSKNDVLNGLADQVIRKYLQA